jgi:hypothetical protein
VDTVPIADVYKLVTDFGLPMLVIYALLSGWLVTRSAHEEMKQDRDWWRNTTLGLLDLSEKTVDVAKHVAEKAHASTTKGGR